MAGIKRYFWSVVRVAVPVIASLIVVACSSGSEASKGAKQGAGVGALAGAVGGMATALVFGGNVADAGARGAVAGGSSGAVVGGMSGAQRDKQIRRIRPCNQKINRGVINDIQNPARAGLMNTVIQSRG